MKKISLIVLGAMLPMAAFADDAELYLSVRRIGLELSKTQVRNSAEYQDSPVSALSATSQDFIKGVFDTALEYSKNRLRWDNSLFMEYGRTTLKPYNGRKTTDENADKILFSSDLTHACWEFGGFRFGPTVRAAYDTQFRDSPDAPRQQILRASSGLSLFDHDIFKNLYAVGVYEYDFTYAGYHKDGFNGHPTSKAAAEVGWRAEYKVRDGVKLSTNGYYREYLMYSDYVPTDLRRDLSAVARMDTNLWGDLTMGPYIQYRRALARAADHYGSNLILGVSFNYITRWGLIEPASSTDEK